jgi:hypothetical protein
MREVDGIPDYIIYRKHRYYYVPFSNSGDYKECEKTQKKITKIGILVPSVIVRCYDIRGRAGWPYTYAVYARMKELE